MENRRKQSANFFFFEPSIQVHCITDVHLTPFVKAWRQDTILRPWQSMESNHGSKLKKKRSDVAFLFFLDENCYQIHLVPWTRFSCLQLV